ncbi:MAG: hypothetical protein H7336_15620 [Bacteriovorax sp.]|nr:hypothetical protein [Bacteriovorax sp.]
MAKKNIWTIPLNKIPDDMTVHQYILQFTDIKNKIEQFKARPQPDYLELPFNFEFEDLVKSVKEGIDQFGLYSFSYNNGLKDILDNSYISSSLTWNPKAIDKISDNPHMATLGSSILDSGSASVYEGKKNLKNTYNDSYSFKERTPLANHANIKKLMNTFKRTIIRSRISMIVAGKEISTKGNFTWHNDEEIYINLRVNIPIQTSPNYFIQILNSTVDDNLKITEFELKKNFAYVYDSHKYHQAYCKKLDSLDRINLICGVSPWFDFDPDEQAWCSNEFYGEMHPFDMFAKGLITTTVSSA